MTVFTKADAAELARIVVLIGERVKDRDENGDIRMPAQDAITLMHMCGRAMSGMADLLREVETLWGREQ